MHILYNITLFFLGISIRVISLFKPKAKEWIRGRKDFFKQLPEIPKGREVIWFHCASLGEFDQGLPLMNALKEENPAIYLAVTFFSPSGMNHYHKRDHKADLVCYIPLDSKSNSKKFLSYLHPSKVFFIKYEFWANHIIEAKKIGAKVYNVSGLFRENHRFFRWYGSFFRRLLRHFDWLFVQNNSSLQLLKGIGITNASINGDSRFDKVIENKEKLQENQLLKVFKNNDPILIIGSSWPHDEELLFPIINSAKIKVIIAPHNIDKNHLKAIEQGIKRPLIRFTDANENNIKDKDVVLLDTIGHLSSAYNYGSLAYVGGGFSGNLHNILEPAVFGMGVIFGPKHTRFPEAQQFIDHGFGFSISNLNELDEKLNFALDNKEVLSKKAILFVDMNHGATDRILEYLNSN